MKTNLIEISVTGCTGSGKSEVCQVIKNALIAYYGSHTQVASRSLSEENNAVGDVLKAAKDTGQSAKRPNTVFVIEEFQSQR